MGLVDADQGQRQEGGQRSPQAAAAHALRRHIQHAHPALLHSGTIHGRLPMGIWPCLSKRSALSVLGQMAGTEDGIMSGVCKQPPAGLWTSQQ